MQMSSAVCKIFSRKSDNGGRKLSKLGASCLWHAPITEELYERRDLSFYFVSVKTLIV